jgi:plastocyanin
VRDFLLACGFLALLGAGATRAATVEVQVRNFGFVPDDVTINPGDSVRWVNSSGTRHNVTADDGSYRSGPASTTFTYTRQFDRPGNSFYYCEPHGSPGLPLGSVMNGVVRVAGTTFAINQGIGGAWYEPATAGQGFVLDVEPASRFLFVAWFTYDVPAAGNAPKLGAPEHRWFTAQGTYNGDTADLQVFQTSGGAFDVPRTTTTAAVGTLQLRFDSCTAGRATYAIPSAGLNGEIALQRAIPGTETLCAMLAAPQ